ncbi:MAG TPA: hypothetical protein VIQ76_06160 [Propionibacteriaceae bacterium]
MAGHGPVVGLGRPLGNVDHVRDPVLALADLPRGPTNRPTGTQTPGQITFQGAAGLHIQRLVVVSVLTCISGRSGKSTVNRPAICSGEYFLARSLRSLREPRDPPPGA